jgi:threonyl-tRNA synthetase
MFTLDFEKQQWALKPMNCPSHCLIFGHRERSYRELPIRMADFGVLHRNEASGALTGLTRVRRFQQDDTHIFCMSEQVTYELAQLFDFLSAVYGKFGFTFKMKLSTRPEKFLGKVEEWDKAEGQLTEALDGFCGKGKWELNPGDGAFYGPKIDITISDALRRDFQCATIQLDFQLPQRFQLEFMTADAANIDASAPRLEGAPKPGFARPVMIHRAIYGSLERFIAILTEHTAGRWPFWLSPRQILIVPIAPALNDYCESVQKELRQQGFHADTDLSGNTVSYFF